MKTLIPLTALLFTGAIQAQSQAFSNPSGYTTVKINPGLFNLVGVTLHEPIVLSGVLDSASANSVVDSDVDFSALAAGVYILELGDDSGIIQEVTVFNANTLTTTDDLSGSVTGGVTSYQLRPASTLDSVFGADNSKANLVESRDGGDIGVDKIILQTASGLSTYFFVNAPGTFVGWFDGTEAAGDTVLNYADGLYVQTVPSSTATDFIISGQVKVKNTGSVLTPGFNLLNPVVPAGLTLETSGLQNYISASADGGDTNADTVLIPDSKNPGTFNTYYYVNVPGTFVGWFDGTDPADNVKLEGAFFLKNKGAVKPYIINGPSL